MIDIEVLPMNISGINVHVPSEADLRRASKLGFSQVRIDIDWCNVEPRRGEYRFAPVDAAVDGAAAEKLKVFATIAYSPSWQGGRSAVPDVNEWRSFVTTVARRYKGKIEAYGMWNEPNLSNFWSGTISEYINLILVSGWDAVKKADPKALVVSPDIATIGRVWPEWMDAMASNKGFFDVLSIHNYESTPQKMINAFYHGEWPFLQGFIPKFRPIKQYIDKIGKNRVWLCEMGWASNNVGLDGQLSRFREFLSSDTLLPVDRIYMYKLRDAPTEKDAWGLHRSDGTSKPAVQAFS